MKTKLAKVLCVLGLAAFISFGFSSGNMVEQAGDETAVGGLLSTEPTE